MFFQTWVLEQANYTKVNTKPCVACVAHFTGLMINCYKMEYANSA